MPVMPLGSADPMMVPHLKQNGANWFSYNFRTVVTVASQPHLLRHLEGRARLPTPPSALSAKPTKDEENEYKKLLSEYEDKLDEWTTRDYVVQQQITSTIPRKIFKRIQNCSTAADMWNTLKKDFEGRTHAFQNKLRDRLAVTKCGDNENVREHVDRIQYMLEELAGMGVMVTDKEYTAMVIKSMPESYRVYFTAISTAVEVSGNSLTPYMVMDFAISEYDRRQDQIENAPRRNGKQTGEGAPFSFATGNGKSGRRGRRSSKGKEKRSCFGCGKGGHLKRDCTEPKREQHQSGCERRV